MSSSDDDFDFVPPRSSSLTSSVSLKNAINNRFGGGTRASKPFAVGGSSNLNDLDDNLFGAPLTKGRNLGTTRLGAPPLVTPDLSSPPPSGPQSKDQQDAEFQALFAAMDSQVRASKNETRLPGDSSGRPVLSPASRARRAAFLDLGLSPAESLDSPHFQDDSADESSASSVGFPSMKYVTSNSGFSASLDTGVLDGEGGAKNNNQPLKMSRYTAPPPVSPASVTNNPGGIGTPGSVVSALSAVELSRVDADYVAAADIDTANSEEEQRNRNSQLSPSNGRALHSSMLGGGDLSFGPGTLLPLAGLGDSPPQAKGSAAAAAAATLDRQKRNSSPPLAAQPPPPPPHPLPPAVILTGKVKQQRGVTPIHPDSAPAVVATAPFSGRATATATATAAAASASAENYIHVDTFDRLRGEWLSREQGLLASKAALEAQLSTAKEEYRRALTERARRDGEALEELRRSLVEREMEARKAGLLEGLREGEEALARARRTWESERESVQRVARTEVEGHARALDVSSTLAGLAQKLETMGSSVFESMRLGAEARERAVTSREAAQIREEERIAASWERVGVCESTVQSLLSRLESVMASWRGEVEGERERAANEGERLRKEGVRLASAGAASKEEFRETSCAAAALRGVIEALTSTLPSLRKEVSSLKSEKESLKEECASLGAEFSLMKDSLQQCARERQSLETERKALDTARLEVERRLREATTSEMVWKTECERARAEREEASRLTFQAGALKEEREDVHRARMALSRERESLGAFRGELMRMLHAAAAAGANRGDWERGVGGSTLVAERGGQHSGPSPGAAGQHVFHLPPGLASLLSGSDQTDGTGGGRGVSEENMNSNVTSSTQSMTGGSHTRGLGVASSTMHGMKGTSYHHPHPNISLLQREASAGASALLERHTHLIKTLGLGKKVLAANTHSDHPLEAGGSQPVMM